MKLIKHLAKQIHEEVDGVIDYAKDALEYKASRPQLAEAYFKLANVENGHVMILHDHVTKIVEEAKFSGYSAPQSMQDKWDCEHKKIIAKMAEAKVYLGMYK